IFGSMEGGLRATKNPIPFRGLGGGQIGKIAVPEHILNKPGKLTDEEFEEIKKHSIVGADILREYPELSFAVPVVLYHHERMDGSGYPFGLKDGEIPLLARILAVADVFDALTSDRPYRKAMKPEDAVALMKKMPLDQEVVGILEKYLSAFVSLKPQVSNPRSNP
ncbi:HD-GYP domain-containing protein, partial [Thermotoga petrophila]|uniref:HD-GYP domain-containing protein n=1 Tax=Thermotoga petrophila TaxID=93929 RepID=UPI002FE20522